MTDGDQALPQIANTGLFAGQGVTTLVKLLGQGGRIIDFNAGAAGVNAAHANVHQLTAMLRCDWLCMARLPAAHNCRLCHVHSSRCRWGQVAGWALHYQAKSLNPSLLLTLPCHAVHPLLQHRHPAAASRCIVEAPFRSGAPNQVILVVSG